MNSLKELFNIFIAIYLGIFTFIGYEIIFPYQKKFILLKIIIYFIFISIIWIRIINKFNYTLNAYYIFSFIIGIIIGIILFKKDIDSRKKKNIPVISIVIYIIHLLTTNKLLNRIKCMISNKKILKKYPYLYKKLHQSEYDLF